MQLFHCETIAQFKIMTWLENQGVEQHHIAHVVKLSSNQVEIGTFDWSYFVLSYEKGVVSFRAPAEKERFQQYIQKQRAQDELRAKVMDWFVDQGLPSHEIAQVTFLSADQVKVTNPAGQFIVLDYQHGVVSIHQEPEEGEQPVQEQLAQEQESTQEQPVQELESIQKQPVQEQESIQEPAFPEVDAGISVSQSCFSVCQSLF